MNEAIQNALHPVLGKTFADGDINTTTGLRIGISKTHVAIAYRDTSGNENTLTVLSRADSQVLWRALDAATAEQDKLNGFEEP